MRNCRLTLAPAIIITFLFIPTGAHAQSAASESEATATRFDAAAYVGWFGGNRGNVGGDTYRDWYSTLLGSGGVGHYWTEHLKTEVEVAVTGRGNLVSFEEQPSDLFVTRYAYRDHHYRVRTLSLVQSYQFRPERLGPSIRRRRARSRLGTANGPGNRADHQKATRTTRQPS